MVEKALSLRVAQFGHPFIMQSVNVKQVFQQQQDVIPIEWLKANERGGQIAHSGANKGTLLQAGTQCLVAIHAAPFVFHHLQGGSQNNSQVTCVTLGGVVVEMQEAFVIVIPGLTVA